MELETAKEIRGELERVESINHSSLVLFEEYGGVEYTHVDVELDTPDELGEPLYGVSFSTFDSLLPHELCEVVAKYKTGGVYLDPDPGIICPKKP